MQVQVLSVQVNPATTKTGKPYEVVELAFKNLSFKGAVEGKKIMPFGVTAATHNVFKTAQPGQIYEVTVVKGDSGYNDWTSATLSDGTAPAPSQASGGPSNAGRASAAPASNSRGFETPEERAAKQIYIVRQSSISSAIALLVPGAKTSLKVEEVLSAAKQLENYVLDVKEPAADGFSDMLDDIPE